MRPILALTLSTLLLSGCVTENSYNGSDKPVVENAINNSGAARTRIALALQYLNTGNNSQAKYNLERASQYAPELPEVHYSLAYYYQQVGENALADKAYQKALALKPDDPNTLNNYGTFLCSINEYDRATDQFLKAIEIPRYIRVAQSYENLALCAIESNDFTNAESYFQQALNHSSQRASTLISLAALYYAKSDLYKASTLIKRYDDTGQVSPRALLLSYLIKQRMGKIEDAEKIAAIILQTYPSSAQARALRDSQIKQTEFELLRQKYRQAQLDELQKDADDNLIIAEPKIKIIRKKAPASNVKAAVLPEQSRVATTTQNTTAKVQTDADTSPAKNTESAANDVKIISFGEPQTPAPTASNNTAYQPEVSQSDVVFYEPTKNASIFSTDNTPTVVMNPTTPDISSDMLNPDIETIKIPTHVVQFGENLFSISVRYNVKLQKLLQWNGLKESDRIVSGQKVYLNDPNIFYKIKEGDTLYDIATKQQVLIDELMRWNKLTPTMALKPGRQLLLVDPDSYRL